MQEQQWETLVAVMARMAAGDRAAWVTLYTEFGAVLTGVVRRHLRRVGVEAISRDDLDDLVIDSCLAIDDCAGAWDPAARVAPWTWAERRIAGVVTKFVGQYADELDDSVLDRPAVSHVSSVDADALDVLGASSEPMARLLRDAFDAARVSERDRRLLVETSMQASLGDPSPATTVGAMFGMKAAAVRQAVKRAKDRLRRLAVPGSKYAPLADLALLA